MRSGSPPGLLSGPLSSCHCGGMSGVRCSGPNKHCGVSRRRACCRPARLLVVRTVVDTNRLQPGFRASFSHMGTSGPRRSHIGEQRVIRTKGARAHCFTNGPLCNDRESGRTFQADVRGPGPGRPQLLTDRFAAASIERVAEIAEHRKNQQRYAQQGLNS